MSDEKKQLGAFSKQFEEKLIEKQIKIAFAQQEMQLQSAWNKRKALL
jgi:hypothetical protein